MKIKLLRFSIISFLFTQALHAQVVANFTATPSVGCAPLTVSFKDISSGSPSSWSWTLGNGNNSNLQNPSATYATAGTYTVTLVASGSIKTSTIIVLPKPTANFTTSALPSCVGQTITFTDNSISGGGPIASWKWDFGDGGGTTTTTGTATHIYTTGGTLPVSVIITDGNGCSNSILKSVTVLPSPVASFTGSPLIACKPNLTVNFTNNSTTTGTVSYLWRFGDGSTSAAITPSHTYTLSGSYKVTLIIKQGACTDSVVKNNYVIIQKIVPDFIANTTSGCAGTTVTFTDKSVPLSTSRIWNFGDGSPPSAGANPTHTYITPGTYTVSLYATANGCSDTTIKAAYITIHPFPVVAFTANNTQSCKAPFTVNFTNQSTNGTSYVWNFGDGSPTSTSQNPSHTYTSTGTKTVTLIVTSANGCVDTLIKPNYIVIDPPVADFTATPREGCIPLSAQFLSTSVSSLDPITNYSWSFGNGSTSSSVSVSATSTYTLSGTYTVRLIITTASGCKDTITKVNYIKAGTPPTANFKVQDSVVCYGDITMFDDLSISADSAFWDFGDGAKTSLLLPSTPVSHLYADTGTYDVRLIVYNNGCSDTLSQPKMVTILPPKPIFTFQLNCTNPYSVTFTDASIGADSLTWDFGDGSPIVSDSLNPVHVYATRGPKSVTLTAWNFTTNCSFPATSSFTIADPIAQFTTTPDIGCYPLPVTFLNTSQDATTTTWHFGDASLDTIATNPSIHTYTLPGLYIAKAFITDVNGCKDTISKNIIVQGAIPNFTANVTTGCAPLPVTFTDNSISDSTKVLWNWTFGDSNTLTSGTSPVSHTYLTSGSFTVKMVVIDKNGCADSITKTNYILPTFPVPKFVTVPDTFNCRKENFTFNASSSLVAIPATYTWKYGDGTSDIGLLPTTTTHSYASDGTYSVTLIVTDKNGCIDSIKHQVFVQHPQADFQDKINQEYCGYKDMSFIDKSTGAGIIGWKWDFGDNGFSFKPDSCSHIYTLPGSYTVSLIVTNSAGCKDTISYPNLVVVPGPVGSFTFTPITGCSPLTVNFTASSTNATEYIWDFGDGKSIITTSPTVQHTYIGNQTTKPQLTLRNLLTNGTACQLPAINLTGSVVVTTFINAMIDSSFVTLKEGDYFIINSKVNPSNVGQTYLWDPPTNLNCTDCLVPSVIGDGSGSTIIYHLTVKDPNGCEGYDSITIYHIACEEDALVPNVFTPNDDGINDFFDIKGTCIGDKFLLQIFDRWGIELFTSETRGLSWDGRTTSGLPVSDGVYFYILTLQDSPPIRGFLQLIR